MSRRARLITGLLVLAAVGLVALAAITYAEQRSFLLDRAGDQVRAAQPIVDRSLDQSGANVPGSGSPQPEPGGPGRRGFGGPGPPPRVGRPPGPLGPRSHLYG